MNYPHAIDDVFATVSMVALAGGMIWLNIDRRNTETADRETARRAALTQAERDQEDLEDWANMNAW